MMCNGARAAGDLFAGRVDEQARLGEVLSASAKGLRPSSSSSVRLVWARPGWCVR